MASSRLAIWVVVIATAGCVITNDFDDYTKGDAASGTSTVSSAAGGSSSSSSGTGGEGGCAADLMTDPQNCGACGWDCGADGACENGICSAVELDLPGASHVAVLQESVLVVLASACSASSTPIHAYPVLFSPLAKPTAMMSTIDSCGLTWSVGAEHAYYAPQEANVITVCTAAACTNAALSIGTQQINGAVEVGNHLVLNAVFPTELRQSLLLDGVPGPAGTLLATNEDDGQGGQYVIHDPTTNAVWWTALEGCLYREAYGALNGSQETCLAFPGRSICRLALAPNGGAFAVLDAGPQLCQAGPLAGYELHAVDMLGMTSVVGPSNVTPGLAADASFVYVGNPDGGLYVLDALTGSEVVALLHPSNVISVDARHPDQLVYTLPDKLVRRRKPPPLR